MFLQCEVCGAKWHRTYKSSGRPIRCPKCRHLIGQTSRPLVTPEKKEGYQESLPV
jgi:DNA-directed RNA polymerase subunit RPC12/RpoP